MQVLGIIKRNFVMNDEEDFRWLRPSKPEILCPSLVAISKERY